MKKRNIENAGKLRIIPLGGLEQIGMNITAFEYEDSIVVVDCGLAFPEDDMLGIDLVIPDFSYLVENKDSILNDFRNKKLQLLFSTTLLERGITIPSVQVLVYQAEHSVFTTASLIQIFGRIGRSFQDPTGIGVCLCQSMSLSIKECISQIRAMNDTVCCATKE